MNSMPLRKHTRRQMHSWEKYIRGKLLNAGCNM